MSKERQREARQISSPSMSTISVFLYTNNPSGLEKTRPLNGKLVKFTVFGEKTALHLSGLLAYKKAAWLPSKCESSTR